MRSKQRKCILGKAIFLIYTISFANIELDWQYKPKGYLYSPLTISSQAIYIGSQEGYLYAINQDGTLKWRYWTRSSIYSSSEVSRGTIYFGCDDGCLYALSSNGGYRWSYETLLPIRSSPTIASDGTVYFGSDEGCFYALNRYGYYKWHYLIGWRIRSKPVIDFNKNVYVGADDGYLYAFDPEGNLLWRYYTGSKIRTSPAITTTGKIYIGTEDGILYALNRQGKTLWSFSTGYGRLSSPVVFHRTIYVASTNGCVYAINPQGKLKWKFQTGSPIYTAPVITYSGRIYVKSLYNLIIIDTSGFFLDFYPIRGKSFIVKYGKIYISSEDGVYALKEISPSEALTEDEPSLQKSPSKSLSYKISPPNISYTLRTRGRVRIELYDISGRLIKCLLDTYQDVGRHLLRWRPESLSPGIYFLKIKLNHSENIEKIIVYPKYLQF